MTRSASFRIALAVLIGGACAAPATAYETGFSSMHSQARVGKKVCMTEHYHYGSGNGRTQALAQRAAIGSWQSFTDFEYGSAWARFSKAAGKRMSCSKAASGFSCQVEARPCK